jgi:hypothetical protein
MPFQNYIQLSRLDQAFEGVPFVNGSTAIAADFQGLETAWCGAPYAGTIGNIISSAPALGMISGSVRGIHLYHPTNSYRVEATVALLQSEAQVGSVGPSIAAIALLTFSEFYGYDPRITPNVQYYADFLGLDWMFNGEPLCQVPVNDSMDLLTLDYFYQGEPFSGATGPKDRIVRATAGVGIFSGAQLSLISSLLNSIMSASLTARILGIVPVLVPKVIGNLLLSGICGQIGLANWIYINGALGSAPVSCITGVRKGYFTPPSAQAVLSGSVIGVGIPSVQITGVVAVLSLLGVADIMPAYKGIVAEPAVMLLDISLDVTIQIRQRAWWGRDDFTIISLPLDNSWADSSVYNRAPTVVGSPVNTVTGMFGSGGSFLAHKDVTTYPYSTDFDIVQGDFNISFRFKPTIFPSWPANGQYDWRICSAVKFEWEWAFPYDPYYPDRGETWGNGWDLRVFDDGYGPQVRLTAYRDYTYIVLPNTLYKMHTYADVIESVPYTGEEMHEPVPLNKWISVTLGREGGQGFVIIDGEQKPVLTDFSFDGATTAFFNEIAGHGYSEGSYALDDGTEFVLGGSNPYSDDPFTNRVYSAALGVIDEFQIDKGACRVFTSTRPLPFPLTSGVIPNLIGGLFSGQAALLNFASRMGSRQIYECQFSGDGLEAVTIPISSFTARQRTDDPAYSEVGIPGLFHMAEIIARRNGLFSVFASVVSGDGSEVYQREMLFESSISTIIITASSSDGAVQNMTVSGYRTTEANEYPKTQPIAAATYISRTNGARTIRSRVIDIYLKPGDTVVFDDDTFIAGSISYYMSAIYGASMEIREG